MLASCRRRPDRKGDAASALMSRKLGKLCYALLEIKPAPGSSTCAEACDCLLYKRSKDLSAFLNKSPEDITHRPCYQLHQHISYTFRTGNNHIYPTLLSGPNSPKMKFALILTSAAFALAAPAQLVAREGFGVGCKGYGECKRAEDVAVAAALEARKTEENLGKREGFGTGCKGYGEC